jgi:hypothetical protein
LIINDLEIIACQLELFKNLIIDFIRDQGRKVEINNLTSAIVSAPQTDKIMIHANMEPRLRIEALGVAVLCRDIIRQGRVQSTVHPVCKTPTDSKHSPPTSSVGQLISQSPILIV